MEKHVKFNYNKITPYIYLGTNNCCEIHFDRNLLKKGITADISLEKDRIDNPKGVTFFLWLPVKDKTAPKLDQLFIGATTIAMLTEMQHKVYVHCKNGHGRAPTMVAAYLIWTGKTPKEALDIIKKKRPEIHLEASQKKILEKFYQSIQE